VLAYENVWQLSAHSLRGIEPIVCVDPATNVPTGKAAPRITESAAGPGDLREGNGAATAVAEERSHRCRQQRAPAARPAARPAVETADVKLGRWRTKTRLSQKLFAAELLVDIVCGVPVPTCAAGTVTDTTLTVGFTPGVRLPAACR